MITVINIIVSSLTLAIVTLFFYLRITRNTPEIFLTSALLSHYYYYIFSLFILAATFLVLSLLTPRIKKFLEQRAKNPSKFLIKLSLWHKKVDVFYKTYGIIFDFLSPYYTRHLVTLAKKFVFWRERTKLLLIIVFAVLPRIVVLLIFILEIYSEKLHYYFYSLVLLLIPLIFRFFIFILKDIGPRVLPEFKKMLIITNPTEQYVVINTSEGIKKAGILGFRLKPEYSDLDLDDLMENFYDPLSAIQGEMEVNFLPLYQKVMQYVLILYFGIHTLGWGYLLLI